MEKYVLAIDQGTTSTRAIIFNHRCQIIGQAQKEVKQYYQNPGWVEQDATEIWLTVLSVIAEVLTANDIKPEQICSIGITNQRETTLIWDKKTGLPVYRALVWQSRQTEPLCQQLKQKGYQALFQEKTGLLLDPYFSGTKIRWILDHIDDGQKRAENGELLFGTIDSWLVWKLSDGQVHVSDYTNASRTLIYNIYDLKWDEQLCQLLNIPLIMLPTVCGSSEVYAYTANYHFFGQQIPIASIAGDQQAALFGQGCFNKSQAKNTYGTGGFLLVNTGSTPVKSHHGLITTLACGLNNQVNYALEGSIFVAGSAVQWLRDGLNFFNSASDSEELALQDQEDTIYVVPAFVGLGAPYWNAKAKGAILGISRGTTKSQITRATLQSIAYQTKDVIEAMEEDLQSKITALQVDGGAVKNDYLMQFQSDILNVPIVRKNINETTALGVAMLAGLAVKFWDNIDEIKQYSHIDKTFSPTLNLDEINKRYQGWKKAVKAVCEYSKD